MAHLWFYIKPHEVPSEIGKLRLGDYWVCRKCGGTSSDIDRRLAWLANDKPPNDARIEIYDGIHTALDCDEHAAWQVHDS